VPLAEGDNVLLVTARDAAGNTAIDTITVTYSEPEPSVEATRGPYLQIAAHSGIVLRWRTDVPTTSFVRYGDGPGHLTMEEGDFTPTKEHEVGIGGLDPDTRYFYSVGTQTADLAGGDSLHVFVTSPPPGVEKRTRIWVIGDTGHPDQNQANVRDAYYDYTGAVRTDLWIHLGDIAYHDGTDEEFQDALFDRYGDMLRTSAFWPTRGNHEGIHSGADNDYYEIFTLPGAGEAGGVPSGTEAYYSFDYGDIHVICLESYDTDRSLGSPMLTWLEDDLSSNARRWTLAFWHHPPYSKGTHDSDTDARMTDMRENVLPILEAGGVDLVLCGHSHVYERSFLLDEHYDDSDTFADSMMVDSGDGRPAGDSPYLKPSAGPAPHEGAVYAVAGNGSRVDDGDLDHPAMVTGMSVLGSLVLDIDGDRLDGVMLDDTGNVRDDFTIIKGTDGDVPPRIGVEPSHLVFTATVGGPNPEPQSLVITNVGGDTLSWTGSADVPWLALDPALGSLPAGESDAVVVQADVLNLGPAAYEGSVTLVSPEATNSPAAVPVTLTVSDTIPQDFPVAEGLVAYWTLDDGVGSTASDASGNGHDGTVNGALWAGGILGGSLLFDGVDDNVDLGPMDVENPDGSRFAASVWFNALSFNGSMDNRILSKTTGASGSDHYWMVSTMESGGRAVLRFRLKTNGNTTTLVAGSGSIAAGEWYHAAATYDGQAMRLYRNGLLVGSTAKSGTVSANDAVVAMIGRNADGSRAWHGLIDDVRIYDRGLTSGQVDSLYQAGLAPPGARSERVPALSGFPEVPPADSGEGSVLLVGADAPGSRRIHLRLGEPSDVRLSLYDVRGRRVDTDILPRLPAGWTTYRHDGRSDGEELLPSGVYCLRVSALGVQRLIKLLILRVDR